MKTCLRIVSLVAIVAALGLPACTPTDVGLGYNPTTGQIDVRVAVRGDGKAVVKATKP